MPSNPYNFTAHQFGTIFGYQTDIKHSIKSIRNKIVILLSKKIYLHANQAKNTST